MSSNIAIKIESLSKCYQIYDKPADRLLQMLMRGSKCYYREFWALKNITFEIKKGETVGIIGRNGSGKSTLLQLICGTLNPSSGNIITNGRTAALLELGSGFNPDFTGRENVYMNAAVLGVSKKEIDTQFEKIENFAEIGEFINQPVRHYSSGMMVRLAFAVQTMINPDILIVDEALSVGDERFQRKCFARIEELKKQGTSILFVSHSGAQIVELCDRAILLEKGDCLYIGLPGQVVRSYQRLIYAPAEEQVKLISAIKEGRLVNKPEPEKIPITGDQECSNLTFDEDFDPSLIPSSTIEYPEQGARICNFQIINEAGKRVNILKAGSVYKFIFNGRFHKNLEQVFFSNGIRSILGVNITGQRFPEQGKNFDFVLGNSDFRVSFQFKLNLLPGTYFVTAAIWSVEPQCPHRIIDAIMFKINPNKVQRSFGSCDLAEGDATFEVFQNNEIDQSQLGI